jgi:hypothetical protein
MGYEDAEPEVSARGEGGQAGGAGAKRSRLARGESRAPVPIARAVRATSPIVPLITVPAPIVKERLQKVESS